MRSYEMLAVALITRCSGEMASQQRPPQLQSVATEVARNSSISIELGSIGRELIDQHDLADAGCGVPAGGKDGYLFLARMEDAHFVLDGELVSLVPQSGAETLPYGVSKYYEGQTYSTEISIDRDSERMLGPETWDYNGRLVIRDANGQIAFTYTGTIDCGA